MAKDVKLVIRAKNEANRAVESITAALKDLRKSQDEVGGSATKTEGLLGQLGGEIKRLNREVKNLSVFSKVATEIERAGTAIREIQGDTLKSAQAFATAARDAEQAAQAVARLRGQAESLENVYREQQAAVAAARGEQKAANAELGKAERLQKNLAKQIAKGKEGSALRSAEVFVAADVAKARQAANDASAAFTKLKGEQDATKNSLKNLGAEISTAAAHERKLAAQSRELTSSTKEKKTLLAEARKELSAIKGVATTAATALGGVRLNQESLADASARAAAELRRTETAMAAMKRYSTGGGNFVDPKTASAMQRQRAEMDATLERWRSLQSEAQRLASAMRLTSQPSEQQAKAFREVVAAARAAKAEYAGLQSSLAALQGSVRSSYLEFSKSNAAMRQHSAEVERLGVKTREAARNQGLWSQVMRSFYGESRKSMSITQRLRGEVLSLATAYLGLYGAIRNIGGVITAYQKLEAAQNRLGAVFAQNKVAVSNELQFLERQAARLGIEFGTISDEYSKFAVAAQAANFESEATRKIFLSVAEAGRVNKLSVEQMSGVFLALTQMISKGKVTSEELRRQLGDRLAGAFNIFADALGISTAQLDDMMRKGEVLASESNLLKFADQLDRRFGGQLAESLRTTTTLLGQFTNEIFQAQLRVGEGGFIESLNEGLRTLISYFRSREGRDFFLSLGAALGKAVDVGTFLAQNIDWLFVLLQGLIGLKVAKFFLGLEIGGKKLTEVIIAGRAAWVAYAAQMGGVRAGAITLRGALTSLMAVARSLIPALALAGVVFGITEAIKWWIGGVDDATEAVDEHRRIMGEVLSAYEGAKGAAKDWAKAVKNVSLSQAEENFRNQVKLLNEAQDEIASFRKRMDRERFVPGGADAKEVEQLYELSRQYALNKISAQDLKKEVERLNVEFKDEGAKAFAAELSKLADNAGEADRRVDAAAVSAEAMGSKSEAIKGRAESASEGLAELSAASETVNNSLNAGPSVMEAYGSALDKLREKVPALAKELKKLESLKEIEDAFQEGLSNLGNMRGSAGRLRQLRAARDEAVAAVLSEDDKSALKDIAGNTKLSAQALELIKKAEGRDFAGSLSTDKDFQKYAEDVVISSARLSAAIEAPLTDAMTAALITLARNGGIPDSVVKSLNQGDYAGAQKGIGSADIAELFGKDGFLTPEIVEFLAKQQQAQDEYVQSLKDANAEREFEVQNLKNSARQQEINKALRDAENEALKLGLTLTADQRNEIIRTTGAKWDATNATNAQEEAEKRVNNLYNLRQQLMEQIKYYEERGDSGKAAELTEQVTALNAQLQEAINKTIALWQAAGGEGADLAIAKLRTMSQSIEVAGSKAAFSGKQMNDMIANNLVRGFEMFAESVAEGENATKAFLRSFMTTAAEFLREIAKMILQQAILNALQGGGGEGGGVGGWLSKAMNAIVKHSGGLANSGRTRSVPAALIASAQRLHQGGLPGLKPGEVPAILKDTEEVLTDDDPRHVRNGGRSMQQTALKVVNMIDSGSFISAGLATSEGEQALFNLIRANKATFKAALA